MARPKVPIDERALTAMAERGWSAAQIAAAFGVDRETIVRRFSDKIAAARQHGSAKLLDVLWQRGVQEKSDKVLLNLADRILGPVKSPQEAANQSQFIQVNQVNQYPSLTPEEETKRIDELTQKQLTSGEEE